jgi:hypothetical protein
LAPRVPVLSAVPGLARFAVTATRRTVSFSVGTTVRVTVDVVRAAASGQAPGHILEDLATGAGDRVRAALGFDQDGDGSGRGGSSGSRGSSGSGSALGQRDAPTLPEMFAELLDVSADVHQHQSGHPAYVRLMAELAPDEARILRLFARSGPQPAVDVRTKRPFGVGSQLVAPGITMIGLHAGCAEPDRVPSYLNNLFRLGFIWFSREAVADVDEYQVLEAQPEVLAARQSAGSATTVLRSIELTAFGKNFCALCGLMDGNAAAARATLNETSRQLPPPDGR